MTMEIVVNVSSFESRIALLEDEELIELFTEYSDRERMVGNIYKGRVERVFPGMGSAFIDIGIEKRAFLHISDIADPDALQEDGDEEDEDGPSSHSHRGRHHNWRERRIENVLKKDQEILVQVTKESIGTKGPKVTTRLSLAGRFCVVVPGEGRVGVSKKIQNRKERSRLKTIGHDLKPQNMGLIIRTIAEEKDAKTLEKDVQSIVRLYQRVQSLSTTTRAPALIHRDLGMVAAIVRDLFSSHIDCMWVDDQETFNQVIAYLKRVSPNLKDRIRLYAGEQPIFDHFGVEADIEKMFERKIWIKAGAYIIIDQTEALVAIDVNTGRFVGKKDAESTIVQANMAAAKEIAKQIRLRDLGGILVVDFIDMERSDNRKKVFEEFRNQFRKDRALTNVYPISELGVIEMTRQRLRPSFIQSASEPCPNCNGTGRVLTPMTVVAKIERWFARARKLLTEKEYILVAHPAVILHLIEADAARLAALAKKGHVQIDLRADPFFDLTSFRILSRSTREDITERYTP